MSFNGSILDAKTLILIEAAYEYGKAIAEFGGYQSQLKEEMQGFFTNRALDGFKSYEKPKPAVCLSELKPGERFQLVSYVQTYTVVAPHPNTKDFVVVLNEHGAALVFGSHSRVIRV